MDDKSIEFVGCINASQAHKRLIKAGFDMSYPTAIKWMLEEGIASQPLGKQSTIVVDVKKLNAEISGCRHGIKKEDRKCPDCADQADCLSWKARRKRRKP